MPAPYNVPVPQKVPIHLENSAQQSCYLPARPLFDAARRAGENPRLSAAEGRPSSRRHPNSRGRPAGSTPKARSAGRGSLPDLGPDLRLRGVDAGGRAVALARFSSPISPRSSAVRPRPQYRRTKSAVWAYHARGRTPRRRRTNPSRRLNRGSIAMRRPLVKALAISASVLLAGAWNFPAAAGWFNAANGKPVRTIPLSSDPHDLISNSRSADPNHAVVGGKNLYYDAECGTWRNAATGKETRTIPLSSDPHDLISNSRSADPNHAVVGGKNLYWEDCPPPKVKTVSKLVPHVTIELGGSDTGDDNKPGFSFGFGSGGSDGSDRKSGGVTFGN